ncbi:MAG: hypothetical protein AAGA77_17945 [Bacteroidota bacterium]
MKRILKILLFSALIVCVFTGYKFLDSIGMKSAEDQDTVEGNLVSNTETSEGDYYTSDTIYRWIQEEYGWVATTESQEIHTNEPEIKSSIFDFTSGPIELDWKILMDIQYKLRYFKELDMEVYAPVFSKEAERLHGKEVIIEGFVIPFDEEGELLSLSFNPYAACFFCGKASPASIISMYLKDDSKRYKIDDYKTFRGTLYLNHDDPNEFYYILKNAREK